MVLLYLIPITTTAKESPEKIINHANNIIKPNDEIFVATNLDFKYPLKENSRVHIEKIDKEVIDTFDLYKFLKDSIFDYTVIMVNDTILNYDENLNNYVLEKIKEMMEENTEIATVRDFFIFEWSHFLKVNNRDEYTK